MTEIANPEESKPTNAFEKCLAWIDENPATFNEILPADPTIDRELQVKIFRQTMIAILRDDEIKKGKIRNCSPVSITSAICALARAGLNPAAGEAYLIPRGSDLRVETSPVGWTKIFMRSPDIQSVTVNVVRDGDRWPQPPVESGASWIYAFAPIPFSTAPIQGAFCACLCTNGIVKFEMMNIEEIEAAKNASDRKTAGGPWDLWFGEMCKKSIMRRAAKRFPIRREDRPAIEALDKVSTIEFDNPPQVEAVEKTKRLAAFLDEEE